MTDLFQKCQHEVHHIACQQVIPTCPCLTAGLARQMLHRWGYDADEQADVAEQLHQYATGHDSDDEDSD